LRDADFTTTFSQAVKYIHFRTLAIRAVPWHVIGDIAGVGVSHVASPHFRRRPARNSAPYPLVALMIAYTMLSAWLSHKLS
jgi:hypothetical protein